MELMQHQIDAIELLDNGKILWGNVGDGKTITALAYYMKYEAPKNILVITTAKKRDSLDWEHEAAKFGIGDHEEASLAGILEVDSWNKLSMYEHYVDTFFIFDEQRLIGHGAWVKSFLKIVRNPGNRWILLSATPGDNWLDYAPVFIANGFYKNITEFKLKHVIYEPFSKYPKIKGYLNETKLQLLRNEILVEMPFIKNTTRFLNYYPVGYNIELFKRIYTSRWNIYTDRPVKDAAEMWRLCRRLVNSDESRIEAIRYLMKAHPRLIIFYNFDYELEILRDLKNDIDVFELNGHVHDPLPNGDKWVYLVQYVAGAEAWNCTSTDAMILYSLTYSYKNFIQAQGRIDRLDTLYTSLYYYILVSNSVIDRAIRGSLGNKKNFNEKKHLREMEMFEDDVMDFEEILEKVSDMTTMCAELEVV